jgi:beta-phosphoglucomutase-like phosphatase (HAD superfamily)
VEDFPQSKPHPQFLNTQQVFRLHKESCIVIEDSTNGVKAAKAAGILCVGYNSIHSEAQDLSKADVIINHFNELDFDLVNLDSK